MVENSSFAAGERTVEIGEAPPAADEANRFRCSGTIGCPERAGNRNAAAV